MRLAMISWTRDWLSGVAQVLARRVESLAHEAGRFVVEIGFVAYELQNRRHVKPLLGKDVFVHISAVERAGLSGLNEGQVVEYEKVSNKGKTSAENLKVQR